MHLWWRLRRASIISCVACKILGSPFQPKRSVLLNYISSSAHEATPTTQTTMMITTTTITVMYGKGCCTNIDCYVQFVRNVILCINHVHVVHLNAVHRTVHEYFIPHILFTDSEFYSHSRTEGKANWGRQIAVIADTAPNSPTNVSEVAE